MSVAGLVLGVIAIVLASASLAWQAVPLLLKDTLPKLTPVVGLLTPEGLVTNDASSDVRDSLLRAAEKLQNGVFIIGVKVINAGRGPLHVAGWAIRADRDGTSLEPVEVPTGGTGVPHDIPPGATALFITEMQHAQRFADVAESEQPPRIVLTVSSGARTYVTKPVAPELLSLGSD